MKKLILFLLPLVTIQIHAASPIQGLLERIDKGASRKFVIEEVKSDGDFFELGWEKGKVVVRGNNNFEYDLVDVLRQAVAEKGRLVYLQTERYCHRFDTNLHDISIFFSYICSVCVNGALLIAELKERI